MNLLHLFVYGTLKDEDFLHSLTNRPYGHFQIMKDAKLPNFVRCSPITIKEADNGAKVLGHLILNIEEIDLKVIDEYESCNSENYDDDEENWYHRKVVKVITSDKKEIKAFAYIPNF